MRRGRSLPKLLFSLVDGQIHHQIFTSFSCNWRTVLLFWHSSLLLST
uniref:Uncharacterized protein n=1 Tax=Siphoviridae sp. ctXWf36 TaxID=2825544 RepID=A0A8S5U2V5_9CAUD|nr:MAG TPA: hypothetical protein [Siphoviridae sp. ctXWf36]DAT98698.1 MAG TPA: hypothetical protein [Caudoviricetes sp.]